MQSAPVRSQGVISEIAPVPEPFVALYRSSRDDVYAYVMTLLWDSSAAEEVIAVAVGRALSRRRRGAAWHGEPAVVQQPVADLVELWLRRTRVAAALRSLPARSVSWWH